MTITVTGRTFARRLPSFTLPLFMASAAALTPALSWAENSSSSLLLEEVVVTAQKRAENILEVPITIDNFSADDISNTGALMISDMDDYIPGFEAGDTGITQNTLTLRGVSSSNISIGGDPSVATFFDGIYMPQATATVAFSDLARVEVLKGPQGTLYGRNASAGVVNLIPNSPAQEEEGFIAAKIGTDGLMRFEGMINTALTDTVALRVNALTNERDGYIQNLAGGGDGGAEDNQALRVAVLWDIADTTSLQVAYDWDKVDNSARPAVGLSEFSYSQDPFSGKMENDLIDGGERRDMQGLTMRLEHELSDQWLVKVSTSYREWEVYNREEEDGTSEASVYADTNNQEDSNIFYNEVSFHFTNDRFDWVMGANYSKEDVMQRTTLSLTGDSIARASTGEINAALGTSIDHIWNQEQLATAINGLGLGLDGVLCGGPCSAAGMTAGVYDEIANLFGSQAIFDSSYSGIPWGEYIENHGEFTNMGVFSDVNITLNDDFNLLLGLRHSRDEKTLSWYSPTTSFAEVRPGATNLFFNDAGGTGISTPNDVLVEATESWSKTTGRVVLKYQFSDNASTFLSFSTGYKAGGFDSLNADTANAPFAPEESTNYEWGVKGDFFDGRFRTQLSIFSLEIDNLQEAIESLAPGEVGATPIIISGNQQLEGIEVTSDWVATDNIRFGLITTLRDEEKSFAPYYNDVGDYIETSETSSTELAYTLTADWTPTVSVGELLVHVDYIFEEQNLQDEPSYQPIYDSIENFNADKQFLNARVSWLSDDQSLELALWGKNLLDNQYTDIPAGRTKAVFDTAYVTPNRPLSWGADVKYSF